MPLLEFLGGAIGGGCAGSVDGEDANGTSFHSSTPSLRRRRCASAS